MEQHSSKMLGAAGEQVVWVSGTALAAGLRSLIPKARRRRLRRGLLPALSFYKRSTEAETPACTGAGAPITGFSPAAACALFTGPRVIWPALSTIEAAASPRPPCRSAAATAHSMWRRRFPSVATTHARLAVCPARSLEDEQAQHWSCTLLPHSSRLAADARNPESRCWACPPGAPATWQQQQQQLLLLCLVADALLPCPYCQLASSCGRLYNRVMFLSNQYIWSCTLSCR